MTPPRCNHPCAPRSTSSVYRLPTIPLLRLGLLDPLTDSTSIASIQDHSNAVHGPLQLGFCREQHHLSAHSSCSVFLLCPLALPTAGAPSGRQHAGKRSEQRRKVGRQSIISRGDFAKRREDTCQKVASGQGKTVRLRQKYVGDGKWGWQQPKPWLGYHSPPKNRLFLPT